MLNKHNIVTNITLALLQFQMILALCFFCVTITSMPSKFPITDPMGNQFLQAYLPMARRSFNGAIWAGEPSVLYRNEQKRHFILIFRCKRRLRLKQYVQYAKRADSNVVYFILINGIV